MRLSWTERAPGVWGAVVGEFDGFGPLSVTGAAPKLEALRDLGSRPLPSSLAGEGVSAEVSPCRTVVRLPLAREERVFGLGLQFFRAEHRGRTRYLRVNSDPRQDTGETHAPVPLYVTSSGYGVLIHTARIVTLCCGSTGLRRPSAPPPKDRNRDPDWQATPPSDLVEAVVSGPGLEVLAFAGGTPLEAVRRCNLFCGGGCLPPRWGLGFWHRVDTKYTDEQVLREAEEFRRRGFPCDVIGLEPGWHTHAYPCTFEWDRERYPDPTGFIGRLRDQGFRVNLWEHGYVHPEAAIHADLEPLSGSHTVWGGLVPDFTLPQAREVLTRQHQREHLERGVAGYKLDECDGSELTGASWMFPGHARFPSGLDGEQMRQVFGLLLQRLTEGMFRERDQRTYGLVRASGPGAPPLPYVLYSDLYDHRQFLRALCNSGYTGLLWTPEVRSARSAEEWVRRMQAVCYSPLAMLNAWCDGTRPWSFPEVEGIVRDTLRMRMRLLPYLYSGFARYHFDGTPPFRAMALGLPDDPEAVPAGSDPWCAVDDQWFVGDSLLVAPLFAGQESREVRLPAGDWYDFDTGERYEGGGQVTVAPGLERIPVFVRDGGIVPLMPPLDHAPRAGEAVPLEVRHYGRSPGRFRLFDDDGETYAYERGVCRWIELSVERSPEGRLRGVVSGPASPGPSSYGEVTWRFMSEGGG